MERVGPEEGFIHRGLRTKMGGQGHAGQWGALYTHCFQEDLLVLRLMFGGRQGGQETKVKHFSWGSLWDSECEHPSSTSRRQWSWEENIPPSWKPLVSHLAKNKGRESLSELVTLGGWQGWKIYVESQFLKKDPKFSGSDISKKTGADEHAMKCEYMWSDPRTSRKWRGETVRSWRPHSLQAGATFQGNMRESLKTVCGWVMLRKCCSPLCFCPRTLCATC